MEKEFPILYSFRRCPYAIRARWALLSSNVKVELREVILKDKPDEFLKLSNSGTVPCLQSRDNIIDESIDIMIWALKKNDTDGWLDMPYEGYGLIDEVEKKFKPYLDQTKYASRFPKIVCFSPSKSMSKYLFALVRRLPAFSALTCIGIECLSL